LQALLIFFQVPGLEPAALDNAVNTVTADNLDLGCRMIEKAAHDKAVRDIDDRLAPGYTVSSWNLFQVWPRGRLLRTWSQDKAVRNVDGCLAPGYTTAFIMFDGPLQKAASAIFNRAVHDINNCPALGSTLRFILSECSPLP